MYILAEKLTALNPALKATLLERLLPAGPRRYIKSRIFHKPLPLPPEVRRQLIEGYREDILKLQTLIERDLSSWLDDGDGH